MESLTSSIVITGHECSTSRVSRVRSVMGYLPLDMHVHRAVRPTLHTPHDRLLLALCLAHVARRVLSDALVLRVVLRSGAEPPYGLGKSSPETRGSSITYIVRDTYESIHIM